MRAAHEAYSGNLAHLEGELGLLNLRLQTEVLRWRSTHPPEATKAELMGFRLTELGADLALDSLADEDEDEAAKSHATADDGGPGVSLGALSDLHAERERGALADDVRLRLPQLTERLGLDRFEHDVLLLALAPELDPRYERLFGYLNDDMSRRWPTVGLALRLFTADAGERAACRRAFGHRAALRGRRLLTLSRESDPLTPVEVSRGLRLEARVLYFLLQTGDDGEDPELAGLLDRQVPGDPAVPDAVRVAVTELRAFLAERPQPAAIVKLEGGDALALRRIAAYVSGAEAVLVLRGAAVAADPEPEDKVARALREADLTGSALLVEDATALTREGAPSLALHHLLTSRCSQTRLLAAAEPWRVPELGLALPLLSLHVPVPSQESREALWKRSLDGLVQDLDTRELAGRFHFKSADIEAVANGVRAHLGSRVAGNGGGASLAGREEVYAACRAQCFASLEGLAQRVESVHTWDDIVLPARTKASLRSIEGWLRYRHVVYEDWGFAKRVSTGHGMAAMFSGSSGTGKTMAAGIIARVLDLYCVDLSSVVSKYIGETEKNLAKIFEAAEAAHAILFFDEADALFGKRSQVKDAHDRHANIEVSYLLQRMESYHGIAILATNIKGNLDVSFARRLQTVVEFPFPSIADRERIWRRLLPAEVPQSDDVDLPFLATQFTLSGGNIKNCALSAALAAAAEETPVGMRHIVRAVSRELAKIGKPVVESSFGPYWKLLRQAAS